MDDRKLEVLIAVAETGSFSKAARRCYCTQSAVTQLMNSVEAELGCRLVERSHSGASLTSAGEALLPRVRQAYDAMCRLKSAAESLARGVGMVRIGAYASIVNTWLPKEVAAFSKDEPDVEFQMRVGSDELVELLRKGDIDLVIADDWLYSAETGGKDPGDGLRWAPLVQDPFFVIAPEGAFGSPGHIVGREELSGHPYVSGSRYVYNRQFEKLFSQVVSVSADDDAPILAMVAQGMGVTVLPSLGVRNLPDGLEAHLMDPPASRTLGIIVGMDPPGAVSRFASYLEGASRGSGEPFAQPGTVLHPKRNWPALP